MQTIQYALQFQGTGVPDPSKEGVLTVKATAQGAGRGLIGLGWGGTSVGKELRQDIEAGSGETAEFESLVTMMGEGAFNESGTIKFGSLGSLKFSTMGRGTVGPTAQDGISAGAVIWKVDSGDGKLSGAAGLITSNFFFNAANEVTDNQFGVLFVP